MDISRRQFCALGGAAALAWGMPRLAFSSDGSGSGRDTLVCVFQRGGMDGLTVVQPYADGAYAALRPTLKLAVPGGGEGALLELDGFFGLHPAAQALKALYDAGELAIVHATGAPHGNRSHFTAQDLMERGHLGDVPAFDGWLNRHLQVVGAGATFQAVGMGNAVAPALRGEAPVVGLRAIADFKLDSRTPVAARLPVLLGALYGGSSALDATAASTFAAIDELAAADPGRHPPDNDAVYPPGEFGRQLAEVAQLIKAGVGLEVACVDIGGWDHHQGQANVLPGLLQQFSEALAAFRTDLGTRMDRVVVVTMSEFGRRAGENASGGTDHGQANVMFALGGGVAGGRVQADWPGLAPAALEQGDLRITTDYRSILAELLAMRLGNPHADAVFPGFTDPGGPGIFLP